MIEALREGCRTVQESEASWEVGGHSEVKQAEDW